MLFLLNPCFTLTSDDIKALWGINIMKKAKKTGSPKAFGVRLEDCQPAVNHKVNFNYNNTTYEY